MKPTKTQQKLIEKIIRNVIDGKVNNSDKLKLIQIAFSLKKRGTKGLILGCTELPLIFPKKFEIPVFDSLEILARALLRKYYK